jgi:hypothetical protein
VERQAGETHRTGTNCGRGDLPPSSYLADMVFWAPALEAMFSELAVIGVLLSRYTSSVCRRLSFFVVSRSVGFLYGRHTYSVRSFLSFLSSPRLFGRLSDPPSTSTLLYPLVSILLLPPLRYRHFAPLIPASPHLPKAPLLARFDVGLLPPPLARYDALMHGAHPQPGPRRRR